MWKEIEPKSFGATLEFFKECMSILALLQPRNFEFFQNPVTLEHYVHRVKHFTKLFNCLNNFMQSDTLVRKTVSNNVSNGHSLDRFQVNSTRQGDLRLLLIFS